MVTDLQDDKWAQAAAKAELTLIDTEMDFPSISLAVAIDGKLVWRAAKGFADVKENEEITFEHQFRIGSTSKAVTAIALGSLYDKGLIDFDKPMGAYDATLAEPVKQVTLGQAMSHRGGIRNYGLCLCFPAWEHLNRQKYSSVRDAVAVIEKSSLLFESGNGYQYTSLGFNLAGLAAESVTKQTFADVMNSEVFEPLGMMHTQIENERVNSEKLVTFYETSNGRYKPAFRVDNSIRWPSGGIVSTPTDLVKLGSAMLDTSLLSDKARSVLLTIPQNGRERGGQYYALGWRVSNWKINDSTTLQAYHHNGTAVGSTSVFVVFPNQGLVISAITNKSMERSTDLAKIVDQVAAAFIDSNF